MQRKSLNIQSIYHNYKIIPLFLCIALLIDYSLTFHFAGSSENILKYEFSPLLVYALENDFVIPYMLITASFYYFAAYAVLGLLHGNEVYPIGVAVILLMSITHVLGGLSWYVLKETYSSAVLTLSLISVIMTITLFAYEVIRSGNR
ncbi:MAG: hypothetical protein ACC612_09835 [Methanomethylovorans sp.]|uniref:hypothetical protein n=1 Tax=Methanomethylovorans sp. TaxID=2758717 RepID=UPI003530E94D